MKAHDSALIEKLIATLERMNLDAYIEHVANRHVTLGQGCTYAAHVIYREVHLLVKVRRCPRQYVGKQV